LNQVAEFRRSWCFQANARSSSSGLKSEVEIAVCSGR
jgi:hypothetical protein